MSDPDTIYALSSGAAPSAIAVVRVSGPAAGDVLTTLAGRMPAPRRASLRTLRDPDGGGELDRAIILWFPGPETVTGEDLAELHVHGGRAVVAAILRVLAAVPGCRAAQAGEFTRRAFLNRRIDLIEAEGLRDLLAAETEAHRRAALAAAGGALGHRIEAWRTRLLTLSGEVEALLDFADEDDVAVDVTDLLARIVGLGGDLAAALARPAVERLRDGLRVVIAGPPNSGKSTLLNALVEREAAIVSDVPGTTRDVLELAVSIDGVALLLLDTAGLRDAAEAIEAEGIRRAEAALHAADIVLWLGVTEPPPVMARIVRVQARADLPDAPAPDVDVRVSVHAGWGLDALVARLLTVARTMIPAEGEAVFNMRQRSELAHAYDALLRCTMTTPLLFVGEELRLARSAFDAMTGRSGVEDMLDSLFSGFCIGK